MFFAFREPPLRDPVVSAREHPFLLVKESDFDELQKLALASPWKELKQLAIHNASNLVYDSGDDYKDRATRLSEIMGANALAYILDPARRHTYTRNILENINRWDDLSSELNKGSWTYEVPPATALFYCILALDIIHNGIGRAELEAAESKLNDVAEKYWDHRQHRLAIWTVRGLWSLYKGEARFAVARDSYRSALMKQMTTEGVYSPGPGYAAARFGQAQHGNGIQHFLDVLEFTETDTYYSDATMRRFHEWLFGYSMTPFGRNYIFGDSAPVNSSTLFSPASYRAYRFSQQAARYVAWNAKGNLPKELLLAYLLMREPLAKPEKPTSRIFNDGGAWFLENNPSPNALAGVLWNPQSTGDDHAHKEVNSLNLCAFGEYLLRNSGYEGWKKGSNGFSWDYISNRAVSGNTALINYSFEDGRNPPAKNDHVSKSGAGISEGFVATGLDYASGSSGSALPNGKHFRNLVFVHPRDNLNGYWVVFDEIVANDAGDTVHLALHPASASYSVIAANEEYQWTINRFSGRDVFLTIFQGTPPRSTEIKEGLLAADWGDKSFVGKYLYITYDTDKTNQRNIVNVFFPHNAANPKAKMTRILGDGYTGAKIFLESAATDVALESSADRRLNYEGISFEALATLYRVQHGMIKFYFVRQGAAFEGLAGRTGFTAEQDISIYMVGSEGKIISPGTSVTFHHPGITEVLLSNQTAPLLDRGNGWVKVQVRAGSYDLKFVLAQPENDTKRKRIE